MRINKSRSFISTVLTAMLSSLVILVCAIILPVDVIALEKCSCKLRKQLEKAIKDDEFLKERYAEKEKELRGLIDRFKELKRPYSGKVSEMHATQYEKWVKEELPALFKEVRGYGVVVTVHPDPKNPHEIDKRKLEEYKRSAECLELVKAVEAHERYHIGVSKDIEAGRMKLETAADLAREEVKAYERGLEILRKALEESKKDCQWKCKFTQEVFNSLEECREHCEKNKPRGLHIATRGICWKKDPRTGEWKGMGY